MVRKAKPELPPYVFEKNGRWYVKYGVPTSFRDKKNRIVYSQIVRRCNPQTAERAAAIVADLKGQIAVHRIEAVKVPTVAEFIDRFLKSKKSSVEPLTHQHYLYQLERYVKPSRFGTVQMPDVTTLLVQDFFNELRDGKASPDAIHRVHTLLAMAFKYAVIWKIVSESPMQGIILPKVKRKESDALGIEQAKRLRALCRSDDAHIIFDMMLETGLRPQECLALAWSDVDLEKKRVRVRNAIAEGFRGGGLYIKGPKTQSSLRSVSFSESFKLRLVRHRELQQEYLDKLQAETNVPILLEHMKVRGVNYEKRKEHRRLVRRTLANFDQYNLVFPASTGKPQSRNNLNRRHFKPLLVKAGIDPLKFSIKHLRHTNASLLADMINPKKLQERLGHKKLETTMKYYVHTKDDADAEVSELLDDALF